MMQISDSYNQKNSLFNAMNRFIGAVNNMDQTVMVPSLLRDVPLGDVDEVKVVKAAAGGGCSAATANSAAATANNGSAYFHPDGDMYSSYMLLKSIRNDIEWGVLQGDERRRDKVPDGGEDELEKEFHFHLNGLYTVLSKLTRRANTLTTRYKEEIGYRN